MKNPAAIYDRCCCCCCCRFRTATGHCSAPGGQVQTTGSIRFVDTTRVRMFRVRTQKSEAIFLVIRPTVLIVTMLLFILQYFHTTQGRECLGYRFSIYIYISSCLCLESVSSLESLSKSDHFQYVRQPSTVYDVRKRSNVVMLVIVDRSSFATCNTTRISYIYI